MKLKSLDALDPNRFQQGSRQDQLSEMIHLEETDAFLSIAQKIDRLLNEFSGRDREAFQVLADCHPYGWSYRKLAKEYGGCHETYRKRAWKILEFIRRELGVSQ